MLFWESCSDIYMRQLSSRGTRKRLDAAISVTGEGATARESVGCTSFSRGRLSYGGSWERVREEAVIAPYLNPREIKIKPKQIDKREGWGKHGLFKYDHMGIRWIFFHQDWNSHFSVELAQR